MNVSQAYIDKRLELRFDLWNVFEDRQSVGYGHLQQISDGVPVILHCQSLGVVAAATTDFAEHIHIGQEIHLDAPLAFALARLATATGNVKRKSSGFVAALARLGEHRIEIADRGKDSGVCRGI